MLLLPLALLLVLRLPLLHPMAALERLQSRFHFGPVDAAQRSRRRRSTPSAMTAGTPSAPWSASPFPSGTPWRPDARGTDRPPRWRTPPSPSAASIMISLLASLLRPGH
ncbi:MAG: hypothetical protein ACLT09_05145 [Flavonifractor plautii]